MPSATARLCPEVRVKTVGHGDGKLSYDALQVPWGISSNVAGMAGRNCHDPRCSGASREQFTFLIPLGDLVVLMMP